MVTFITASRSIVWDFDSTITPDPGYSEEIPPPRPEIVALMRRAHEAGLKNVIASCRWSVHELNNAAEAERNMVQAQAYLAEWDIPYDELRQKPLGEVYIDDKSCHANDLAGIESAIAKAKLALVMDQNPQLKPLFEEMGFKSGVAHDLTTKAVEHFGLTNDPKEAGYILADGRMLDFSGKRQGGSGGERVQDHREISHVFDGPADAMDEFMRETGAVRFGLVSSGSLHLDFRGRPTNAQVSVIRRAVVNYMPDFIEIDSPSGHAEVFPVTVPLLMEKLRGLGLVAGLKPESRSITYDDLDLLPGGKAAGRPDSDFDAEALDEGQQHELEHTNDHSVAREIAKDHLAEDPDYYKKLAKIEGQLNLKASGDVHQWGCLMVDFPEELAEQARAYAAENIPDEVLYLDPEDPSGYGRESQIHVTVAYGLDPKMDRQKVADLVAGISKPVKVRLGKISKFEPEKYDVIKVEVESDDLRVLHEQVKALGVPGETYPDYKPHLTLAYVQKGAADYLLGQTPFEGQEFELTQFDYSAPPEPGSKDKHTKYQVKAELAEEGIAGVGKLWISPDGKVSELPPDNSHAEFMNRPAPESLTEFADLIKAGWSRVGFSTTEELYIQSDKPIDWVLARIPTKMLLPQYISVEHQGQHIGVRVLEGEDALDAWKHRNDVRHRVRAARESDKVWVSPEGKVYVLPHTYSEHADNLDFPGMVEVPRVKEDGMFALMDAGWSRAGLDPDMRQLYIQTNKDVSWALSRLPQWMKFCKSLVVEPANLGSFPSADRDSISVLEGEDALDAWKHRNDVRHRVAATKGLAKGLPDESMGHKFWVRPNGFLVYPIPNNHHGYAIPDKYWKMADKEEDFEVGDPELPANMMVEDGWVRGILIPGEELNLDSRDDAGIGQALKAVPAEFLLVKEIVTNWKQISVDEGEDALDAWKHRNDVRHRVAAFLKIKADSYWVTEKGGVIRVDIGDCDSEHYDALPKKYQKGNMRDSMDAAYADGWARVIINDKEVNVDMLNPEDGVGRVLELFRDMNELIGQELLLVDGLAKDEQEIQILEGEDALDAWKHRNDIRHRVKAAKGLGNRPKQIHKALSDTYSYIDMLNESGESDFADQALADIKKAFETKGYADVLRGLGAGFGYIEEFYGVTRMNRELMTDLRDAVRTLEKIGEKGWNDTIDPGNLKAEEDDEEMVAIRDDYRVDAMRENTTKMWISPEGKIESWVWDQSTHHVDKIEELTGLKDLGTAKETGWCRVTVGKNRSGKSELYLDAKDDARVVEALEILEDKYPEVVNLAISTDTFTVVEVVEGESLSQAWKHRNDVRHRMAASYRDEGFTEDGHWGSAASGVLYLSADGRVLLLKRSADVEEPGTWGIPGGAIPVDDQTGQPKDALASALAEAAEEMGGKPEATISGSSMFRDGDFTFTTFFGRTADTSFKPSNLGWESDAWGWFGMDELPSPLHPGVVKTLNGIEAGLSPVLYHSTTGPENATSIINDDEFKLSVAQGSDAKALGVSMPKGKFYYLSTARSMAGAYGRVIGDVAATLVLDGDSLSDRYSGDAVDYWGPEFRLARPESFEMEDRVWSKDPTIPNATKYITAVLAYFNPKEPEDKDKRMIRALALAAKTKGLPFRLYTDKKAYGSDNEARAVPVTSLDLKTPPAESRKTWPRSVPEDMEGLVELFRAPVGSKLTPKAEKVRNAIIYHDYAKDNFIRRAEADLHNNRRGGRADSLIEAMREAGVSDVKSLVDQVAEKWRVKEAMAASLRPDQARAAIGEALGEASVSAWETVGQGTFQTDKMTDILDRTIEKLSRWGAFEAYSLDNFGIPFKAHQVFAGTDLVFVDRYQALGIPYPDPKTCCPGQCEGTGWVPIHKSILGLDVLDYDEAGILYPEEDVELWRPLWEAAEAEHPSDDGWHFVQCPTCGGTGKIVADLGAFEFKEEYDDGLKFWVDDKGMLITVTEGTHAAKILTTLQDEGVLGQVMTEAGVPEEDVKAFEEGGLEDLGDMNEAAFNWADKHGWVRVWNIGDELAVEADDERKVTKTLEAIAKQAPELLVVKTLMAWGTAVPVDEGEDAQTAWDHRKSVRKSMDAGLEVKGESMNVVGYHGTRVGDELFDEVGLPGEDYYIATHEEDAAWYALEWKTQGVPAVIRGKLTLKNYILVDHLYDEVFFNGQGQDLDDWMAENLGLTGGVLENQETITNYAAEHGYDGVVFSPGFSATSVGDDIAVFDPKSFKEEEVKLMVPETGEWTAYMSFFDAEMLLDGVPSEVAASERPVVQAAQPKIFIPKGVAANVRGFDGTLAGVKDWRAKIVLGNNLGGDKTKKKGGWDGVGYVMVNPTSGAVVPVALGDEHQTGYELLYHYQDKGLLNAKGFTPLTHRMNYLDMADPTSLKLLKFWLDNGGPDAMVAGKNREQGRMSDWIAGRGTIKVEPGKLAAGGKEWLQALEKFSKLWASLPSDREPDEDVVTDLFDAAYAMREAGHRWSFMWASPGDVVDKLFTTMDYKALGNVVLGMAGTKNRIHTKLKELLDNPKDYEAPQFRSFFGDLAVAKAELDRLGSIKASVVAISANIKFWIDPAGAFHGFGGGPESFYSQKPHLDWLQENNVKFTETEGSFFGDLPSLGWVRGYVQNGSLSLTLDPQKVPVETALSRVPQEYRFVKDVFVEGPVDENGIAEELGSTKVLDDEDALDAWPHRNDARHRFDSSLMAENKFDRLYKEAVAISQDDAKYSQALEVPALAQEQGQFQQAVKDARSEAELQQAWARFSPSVTWEALVTTAGQQQVEGFQTKRVKNYDELEQLINDKALFEQWKTDNIDNINNYLESDNPEYDAMDEKEKEAAWENQAEVFWNDEWDRVRSELYDYIEKDTLDLWRQITVKDVKEFLGRLSNEQTVGDYTGIGPYWTHTENSAEAYWGGSGVTVTLHGRVRREDVDWYRTALVQLNLSGGDQEDEIRLIEGVPVEIVGVETDDGDVDLEHPVIMQAAMKDPIEAKKLVTA